LVVVVYGCVVAMPGLAYWATRFADAQAKAPTIVIARAQVRAGQQTHILVLRTVVGRGLANDLVIGHPHWFNGSKILDQHMYLVLLTADNEPYRGELTSDGVPLYSCGLINALEVVDEAIPDSDLYDVKYMQHWKPIPLVDIERHIREAHGVKDGV